MIEIQTLFILPNELVEIKEYFLIEERKNNSSFKFISVNDINLATEIENSDIQIILLDSEIGFLTEEILQKMNRDDYFISFSKKLQSNVNLNKISKDTINAHKKITSIKKSLTTYDEFDLEEENNLNLKKDIQDYLDLKIPKMILKKEAELRPNLPSTYLEAIKIENYFSIKDMEIDDLKDKKEIYFVGENGDGKTVLLQAILLALKSGEDKYSIFAEDYIKDIRKSISLSTKDEKHNLDYKNVKNVKNVFAYGISRNKYDSEATDKDGYSGIFETPLISIKLRNPQDLLREDSSIVDKFIEKLNDTIFINDLKIKKDADKNLVFMEKNIPIKFHELSEGYKSTIIWLCDLLSRLKENQPEIELIEKYQAIVLIDEVDLYLHPKWKYEFINNLRSVFESIQFIMTTHSVVTVLGAREDAVFYKIYKEDGVTKVSQQIDDISYYTSDILMSSPLFNLDKITARSYKDKLSNDDYVYHRIHKKIKERIKDKKITQDDEVDSWLDEEFDAEFGE